MTIGRVILCVIYPHKCYYSHGHDFMVSIIVVSQVSPHRAAEKLSPGVLLFKLSPGVERDEAGGYATFTRLGKNT